MARLVLNRLEIVENSASRPLLESVHNRPHDCGLVGPQLLLVRGVTFLSSSNRVDSGPLFPWLVRGRSFTVFSLIVGVGKLPTLNAHWVRIFGF